MSWLHCVLGSGWTWTDQLQSKGLLQMPGLLYVWYKIHKYNKLPLIQSNGYIIICSDRIAGCRKKQLSSFPACMASGPLIYLDAILWPRNEQVIVFCRFIFKSNFEKLYMKLIISKDHQQDILTVLTQKTIEAKIILSLPRR